MKKETLIKLSNALREKVYSKIPNLHFGGCGFAALALYDALSNKGERVRLMSCGEYSHLMVEVKTKWPVLGKRVLLDSREIEQLSPRWWETDRETLSDCLKDVSRWNPSFNRDYAKRIRRRIFKVVEEVLTD